MEQMEAFGVPRRIVAFVIPAGYSFNLDGTTLYLAVTSIFVAQAAGIHLPWTQQIDHDAHADADAQRRRRRSARDVGDPARHTDHFHLPVERMIVMLGVDAMMDMARTTVNVIGNCLATVVVAKSEHAFRTEQPSPAALEAALDV